MKTGKKMVADQKLNATNGTISNNNNYLDWHRHCNVVGRREGSQGVKKYSQIIGVALLLVGLAISNSAINVHACSGGGTCTGGGGGLMIDGKIADQWFGERKQDPETIAAKISPLFAKLEGKVPNDFLHAFRVGVNDLDWYYVDRDITSLPIARTGVPFDTEQVGRQMDGNVFFDIRKIPNSVEALAQKGVQTENSVFDFEQWFIAHELGIRLVLAAESAGVNFKPFNALKLTDYLVRLASDTSTDTLEEVRQELVRLGFYPVSRIANNPADRERQLQIEDVVEIPIELSAPILVRDAQRSVEACLVGRIETRFGEDSIVESTVNEEIESPIQHTLLGDLLRQYVEIAYPDLIDDLNWSKAYVNRENSKLFDIRTTLPFDRLFGDGDMNQHVLNIPVNNSTQYFFTGMKGKSDIFVLGRSNRAFSDAKWHSLQFLSSIPTLSYDAFGAVYDSFGEIRADAKLENIRVSVPASSLVPGIGLATKNSDSDQIVSELKGDAIGYIDCLQREMEIAVIIEQGQLDSPEIIVETRRNYYKSRPGVLERIQLPAQEAQSAE